jgi:hypothetical protein
MMASRRCTCVCMVCVRAGPAPTAKYVAKLPDVPDVSILMDRVHKDLLAAYASCHSLTPCIEPEAVLEVEVRVYVCVCVITPCIKPEAVRVSVCVTVCVCECVILVTHRSALLEIRIHLILCLTCNKHKHTCTHALHELCGAVPPHDLLLPCT